MYLTPDHARMYFVFSVQSEKKTGTRPALGDLQAAYEFQFRERIVLEEPRKKLESFTDIEVVGVRSTF